MQRIPYLEDLGARVAAISGREDGDCGGRARDPEPRRRFVAACGATPERLAVPHQVHGARVLPVDALPGDGAAYNEEADALITRTPGLAVGVTVADCVPVLLYDPVRRAAGAVHAGREGTRANIAAGAVAALGAHYGCDPAGLHAYIGPSAGPCCYEVSREMADTFRALGLPAKGRMLDLWAANRQQLEAAGLPAAQIMDAQHCTICGNGFYSYRGGDAVARNLALILC